MSRKTAVRTKGLSLFIVWMLAASLLMSVASLFASPASAQNCDRGGAGSGDWTVSNAQVCENIVIVMDGNLIITAAGSLTIRNGGIKFVEDTTHVYSVSVSGDLIFEQNSKMWTETNLVNPYMKLGVTVSGAGSSLSLTDSTFAFPGTIGTDTGAVVRIDRSTITRTEADVDAIFSPTSGQRDENDDAPGLTFDASIVSFFASRVERLYENASLGAPDVRQSIRLTGSTTFTAVDTFLGIDFNPLVTIHNTLSLAGTANAYLYGVTVDSTQNPGTQDQWVTAITAVAGTRADLYRWADVTVRDARGVPVNDSEIDAVFSGAQSGPATFRDNGGLPTPPAAVLAYMGKGVADWDNTGLDGRARMPLLSDWIDSPSLSNSQFVGAFTLTATAPTLQTGEATLTFDAYPLMGNGSASKAVTVTIGGLVQPLPDLLPAQPTFSPATPLQGDNVTITAFVRNQGTGGAANIVVRVFDGITLLLEDTIGFIGGGGQASVTATLANAAPGNHAIRVVVDPNNAIIEEPPAGAEQNNAGSFPLSVTPFGPDLAVGVSFDPDPGFLNNPVTLRATVSNVGDGNATNVRVNFYQQEVQPDGASTPLGSATLPFVDTATPAVATLTWTPTSLGTFKFWAWVDPQDSIPEPLPYDNSMNNKDSKSVVIGPSPDLVVLPQDLTMVDPFPRAGVAGGTIEAVVRNSGQLGAGAFRLDFFVDGLFVGSQNVGGLAIGARTTVTQGGVAFNSCGPHSIEVLVDAGDAVTEGVLYESNNRVTKSIQVYPTQFLAWNLPATVNADQAVSTSIEIGNAITIDGAQLMIVQDQDPCGRYYVKVMNGGSLTLLGGEVSSNWPLAIFVATGGTLIARGATFTLDTQGSGILYSRGTLSVWDSTIGGDVVARGSSADLRRDTFEGDLLHINTATVSRLWDADLLGVSTIEFASDQTGGGAVDFDIRNTTFNAQLTGQLVFGGDQWAQLTSVTLTKPGDWWSGMLTQSAHVTRYWWLTVEAVDGTGTPIQDPTTSVSLQRFNPATLQWDAVQDCSPDECYYNWNNSWPMVGIPTGRLLYRAAAEDRYGSLPPSVRATYRSDGWAFIEGQVRKPDAIVSALVDADTAITLVFSELTPDLSITDIRFDGDNGNNVASQPIGRPLDIVATVANSGEIITRGVIAYCYSTDVDVDRDGYMDNSHASYVASGLFIGQAGPTNVSALSSAPFTCTWTPTGTLEGSRTVSVVVDPSTGSDPRAGGAIAEISEANNTDTGTVVIFTWPDLHFAGDPVVSFDPPTPIVDNDVTLTVQISNEGTNTATNAVFGVYTTGNVSLGTTVTATVARGVTTTITLVWRPTLSGLQTIRIRVQAAGAVFPGDFRNWDFDLADNFADKPFDVQTQPELSIAFRDPPAPAFRNAQFMLNLTVTNTGQTTAPSIVITVVDEAAPTVILGAAYGITVPFGSITVFLNTTLGLSTLGNHNLTVKVDANNTVREPNELNNEATAVMNVLAPNGSVRIETPSNLQTFRPGVSIGVSGKVLQTGAFEGTPIGGVLVTATLLNAQGNPVPGVTGTDTTASNDGSFLIGLNIPANLADGTYTIRVDAADQSVLDRDRQIVITTPLAWWAAPFLGLPVWIWLIVIIGAAAAIGGGTAYVKFVGLGKLVECGECGAFIPEESTKCPKCGVEFEKDMAKCSNCQAWIPVDVKQCPECGVEFATGEVEMADYEAQMRRQYDDVKRKFREDASRELGRSLSDKEFEDWWRTQPTFVTFEDWLREEEEMRRMGSKPCPVCNTLNSVTATVCHKCGTLLKEDARRPGGGRPPAAAPRPVTPAAAPSGPAPSGEEAAEAGMPSEAIPKKVVKKPVMGAPVVQKKVIKRPLEEQKEGEGGEGTGGDEEQI